MGTVVTVIVNIGLIAVFTYLMKKENFLTFYQRHFSRLSSSRLDRMSIALITFRLMRQTRRFSKFDYIIEFMKGRNPLVMK